MEWWSEGGEPARLHLLHHSTTPSLHYFPGPAVHPRPRGLARDDLRLGVEHSVPALLHRRFRLDLFGKLEERQVMPVLAGPEAAVELAEFGIIDRRFPEELEPLARARLDQAGDEQAVHQLRRAGALADEAAE